jgi:uncharacterized protein (TIGR03118 family)
MKMFLRLAAGTMMMLSLPGAVAFGQHYTQTNLVSNDSGTTPDSDLVNPWGMSRSSGSPWWVSDNGTGLSTLYNGAGTKQGIVVTIPAAVAGNTGTPTGTIYNGSPTDFLLAPGAAAHFLFATEDGTVAGWNSAVGVPAGGSPPSKTAITVVKTTDGSSFKGLTSATVNGKLYLYVANFAKGRVDVYDTTFTRVHFGEDSFSDEQLPWGYSPFNVQAIGNDIVVTYALHEKGSLDETDGAGLGHVDVYSPTGHLLRRLQHGAWLNAPWGVALAPLDFGVFSHDLLIGQFGSGNIAAYDLASGRFEGLLEDTTGAPIAIDGLWDISPGNASTGNYNSASAPATELYFTAGPGGESGGLIGYLTAISSELIKGNAQ